MGLYLNHHYGADRSASEKPEKIEKNDKQEKNEKLERTPVSSQRS
jgi:hypothetical protein